MFAPKHRQRDAGLLLLFLLLAGVAQGKEIALTFDDAPRPGGLVYSGQERAKRIVQHLEKGIIRTLFLANSVRMDKEGERRLRFYARHGHGIGNHTHSHPDLHLVSNETFIDDIELAEEKLSAIPTYSKWFRFPFLHEGATRDARDVIRGHLKSHGYRHAYVTVDNYDWYLDSLLQSALKAGKRVRRGRLCRAYADMLEDGIAFYDAIAQRALKRSPKHVLLLHENDLAALCLGKLVARLNDRGWKILSPEEAYRDPISSREPDTLMLGQGRVAALAHEAGLPGPFVTKWEEESEIEAELNRRKIFVD